MKVQDFQKKWCNGETAACRDRVRHDLHELLASVTSVFVQRPWRVPNTSQILLKIMGPWGLFRGLDSGVRNSMAWSAKLERTG